MTIKFRLLLSLTLLSVALLVMSAEGFRALYQMSGKIDTIVNDRVVPLQQLKRVADMYAVNIVDTAHKVGAGTLSPAEGTAALDQANAVIEAQWGAYLATFLTEQEKALAEETKAAMNAAGPAITRLEALFTAGDVAGVKAFAATDLYPAIDPIGTPLSGLVDLQLRVAQEEHAAARDVRQFALTTMLLIASVSVLVVLFAGWTVVGGVVRPIVGLQRAMKLLADGDLAVDIPSLGRRHEVGAMAAAVQVFKDNGLERRSLEAAAQQKQGLEGLHQQVLQASISTFRQTISEVITLVAVETNQMRDTAVALKALAGSAADGATNASRAADNAAGHVQSVAAVGEELNASSDEISRQVTNANTAVLATTNLAREADQGIEQLSGAVEDIGSVVDMISTIASQTNLLALNATIEAARAGEAGRGFAVVATEVKTLAGQTATATTEIGRRITNMQASTTVALQALREITGRVESLSEVTRSVAAAVVEQQAATQEMSRSLASASDSAREASRNVVAVDQTSRETAAGADGVEVASTRLTQASQQLSAAVHDFLDDVGRKIEDRRSEARVPVRGTASVVVKGVSCAVRLHDAHTGGARIENTLGLKVGDQVSYAGPGEKPRPAKVAWADPQFAGLQFMERAVNAA